MGASALGVAPALLAFCSSLSDLLPEPPPLPFTLKSQQVLAEPLCLLDGVFPIFLRCVWCLTDWWGS